MSADELPDEAWSTSIYYGANEDVRQVELERVMQVHWSENPHCSCTRAG